MPNGEEPGRDHLADDGIDLGIAAALATHGERVAAVAYVSLGRPVEQSSVDGAPRFTTSASCRPW